MACCRHVADAPFLSAVYDIELDGLYPSGCWTSGQILLKRIGERLHFDYSSFLPVFLNQKPSQPCESSCADMLIRKPHRVCKPRKTLELLDEWETN